MNEVAAHRAQQSWLSWYLGSLGIENLAVLGFFGLMSFILTLVVVLRGKGAAVGPALIFVVPLPFAVGVFLALRALIGTYSLLSIFDGEPASSELAQALASAMIRPSIGMLLSAPSYLLAASGLFVRALRRDSSDSA